MDTRFKAPFGEHKAHNRGGHQMQTRGTYSQRGGRQVVMRDNIQQDRQVFGNEQPVNKQAYRNNFEQSHRNNFAQAQRGPFLCGGNYNKRISNQQNDGDAQVELVKKREKFGEAKDGQRGNFAQAQINSKFYKPVSNQQSDGNAPIELVKKREKFGEAKDGQREKVEQKHHDADKKVTTGWDESAGQINYASQAQKQNDVDIDIQMSKICKQLKSMSIEALPQKEEANEKAKSEEGFHFDDRFAHENCNVKHEAHLKKESQPAVNDYDSNFLYLDSRPINLGRRILVPIVNKGVNYAGLLIGEEGATAHSIRRMFNCRYAVLGQFTDEPLHIKIRITAPAIEAYERMHRVLKYLHALFEKAHSGQVPQHHLKIKSKSIAEEYESPICNESKSLLDKTFAELLQIEVDKLEAQRDNKLIDAPNTDEVVPKLAVRKDNEFVDDSSSIDSSMSSFITVHEYSSKSLQRQAILPSAPKTKKPIKVVDVDFEPSNCSNFNDQAKLTVCDEKSNQLIKEAHNQIAKYATVKKDSKEMSLKKKLALELGRIGHSGNGDSGFAETDTILTSTMRRDISRRCAA